MRGNRVPQRRVWALVFTSLCAAGALIAQLGFLPSLIASICGPLVIAGIIAWIAPRAHAQGMLGFFIVAALSVSMVADGAIKVSFVAGLALFLVAHVLYMMAFVKRTSLTAFILPLLFYGVVAIGVGQSLLPSAHDQGLMWPVIVYISVVTLMATMLGAAGIRQQGAYLRAAIGGGLFFVSDTVIGVTKFLQDFPYSSVVILSTYWLAQLLIASVLMRGSHKP